ncbi:hypothetical protein GCM10011348_47250 [Marinobacterium nitratireducens]|uniref:DUF1302 domain-containing protein n=1 Tax=Marinobacterium nitratireducens TaxID=518897 RepID=A0A918DZ96_9GAMM|nr:DUF1302 family protein [Marinobacterium nitratireducens]GGO89454.1 hypothetical protein GCM10011348_47250 [Marinobacterium nitratireducens]
MQATLGTVLACAAMPQAQALSFELDNGLTLDLDTTLTYDAQWRMEERDPSILAVGGGQVPALLSDDGNRNFDQGDMIQNRISFSTDLDANYGNGGVFLRVRGWYDDVYNDDSLAEQHNPLLGTGTPKPYQQDGIDLHESDIELLDAFFYQGFDIGDRRLSLRAGRQAVNWGESLFINGGISSAQGPLDATKANAPGVELKDIFLPIGQVYGEIDLTDSVSMGAYFQYEWEKTRIDAPGSYFNVLDVIGQEVDGDAIELDPANLRVRRDEPDAGQYGVALRYLAEQLNNTEFGLYYLRFNDFTPAIQFLGAPGIELEHFEDIELLGMSFGTVFGDTNISGEFNYRHGQPVRLAHPAAFYYSEADTLQAQVSVSHVFGASSLWDNLVLLAEIGHNRVLHIDDDATARGLGIDVNDTKGALDGDRSASGFVGRLSADYYGIANGLDLNLSATYRNDFNGVSSVPFTFAEGSEVLGLKADFTYTGGHSFGASYNWFLTDPDDILEDQGRLEVAHLNADRDYLSLYYKYRF